MLNNLEITDLIIPALNEEASIGKVISSIPTGRVRNIIVADNGSTDRTSEVAAAAGAIVVSEPSRGYGAACLRGMEYILRESAAPRPGVLLFMDADYSDDPAEIPLLLEPIRNQGFDMVIGSRVLGNAEKGALSPQQRFGNRLATFLLRVFYRARYTDLGPFRAIRFDKLLQLDMKDRTWGWTVEMQLKAAKNRLKVCEVPVSYRKRIGVSKISGTLSGSVKAGWKILLTIFRYL